MKLVYFDGRGLAETSRLIFALNRINYEDFRYPLEIKDWKNYIMIKKEFDIDKQNDKLLNSLNKVPYLHLDNGKIISQSKSIERYLSKKYDMMGDTLEDEALIDSICENIRDFKDLYHREKRKENKEDLKNFFNNILVEKWKLLENILCLQNSNYSVNKNITLADIVIFSFINDYFDDKKSIINSINNCEKIKNIYYNVKNNENIKKWLEKRPLTAF